MVGQLSRRQTNVIVAGAVFLVCFLLYSFVLSKKMKDLKDLKVNQRIKIPTIDFFSSKIEHNKQSFA